jgi:glutamine synthetase
MPEQKAIEQRKTSGNNLPLDKAQILDIVEAEGVRFLRLQFTDILGIIKNVEVPRSQFEAALDGKVMFDGSSIEGFVRIEESDMRLVPDLSTFRVLPWDEPRGRVGRLICDVHNPDGTDFDGCPRLTLKRAMAEARALGFEMMTGPEAEFFLFLGNKPGEELTTETHDAGGYFDLAPIDLGEDARRDIVVVLESMGFEVEAAHHEVAPAQHEIDFKYADALTTADNVSTFRWVVRKVARDHGLHATFMPKPIFGQNGSGMHTHQSLFLDGTNAFYGPDKKYELSDTALYYIGGILRHARGFCAITNPLVNSYKRLVPGYEAPTMIAWSERNRSPLIRVPELRGIGTRIELRMPDPSCNPYLAFAVMLRSGLDGIKNQWDPGEPVNKNVYTMSTRERRRLGIDSLPADLNEALISMERDPLITETLGEHITSRFVEAKRAEWSEYIAQVHPWETARYLATY